MTRLIAALHQVTAQLTNLRTQLRESPLALLACTPLGKVASQAPDLVDDGIAAIPLLRATVVRRRVTTASNVFLEGLDLRLQPAQSLPDLLRRACAGLAGRVGLAGLAGLAALGIARSRGCRRAALGIGAGRRVVFGHGAGSPRYRMTGAVHELLLLLDGHPTLIGRNELLDDDELDDDELDDGSAGHGEGAGVGVGRWCPLPHPHGAGAQQLGGYGG